MRLLFRFTFGEQKKVDMNKSCKSYGNYCVNRQIQPFPQHPHHGTFPTSLLLPPRVLHTLCFLTLLVPRPPAALLVLLLTLFVRSRSLFVVVSAPAQWPVATSDADPPTYRFVCCRDKLRDRIPPLGTLLPFGTKVESRLFVAPVKRGKDS